MSLNELSQGHKDLYLAQLDSHIEKLDKRTRSFQQRLEKYHFFVIGKQRIISPTPPRPEHYIISSDTDTAFVGEDRLLRGNGTPIRRRNIIANEMSTNAQNLMFLARKILYSISAQTRSLKLKFGAALSGCAQRDRETDEKLEILRDWLKGIERRIEILREDTDRITAMENDGWEIGVVVTSTEEWEFDMRAHQWRYDRYM